MNDTELSALVAEHVAGWKWWWGDLQPFLIPPRLPPEANVIGHDIPPYATSADAVIPLLERWLRIEQARHPELNLEWWAGSHKFSREPYVELAGMIGGNIRRYAPTIARAACLALLEAHNITAHVPHVPPQAL